MAYQFRDAYTVEDSLLDADWSDGFIIPTLLAIRTAEDLYFNREDSIYKTWDPDKPWESDLPDYIKEQVIAYAYEWYKNPEYHRKWYLKQLGKESFLDFHRDMSEAEYDEMMIFIKEQQEEWIREGKRDITG